MAEVMEYDNVGMLATSRCDRCGGQAYVEVLLGSGSALLFCAHHYTEGEGKLRGLDATIADHRQFLVAEEGRLKAQPSR